MRVAKTGMRAVLIGLLGMVLAASAAEAEIVVLQCKFESLNFFVTRYSDGSPARIGTTPGLGDRAQAISDHRTGAWVFVEVNTDGIPITLTTVAPDFAAVHSRHTIGPFGEVLAPSQERGKCERVPI